MSTTDRLLSLAAGTVLDIGPAETVEVAAETGWGGVGLWFDPSSWTDATTKAVIRRLDATGLVALDMEPVILGRGEDPGDRLVDTAAEVGARHVLVCSGPASRAATVERYRELCRRAEPAGVRVVLEFLPIFTIATLADALGVVQEVDCANAGVLVDTLHLSRSGGAPGDLDTVPPGLLPYLQLADASATPADTSPAGLRDEALHGRLLPGQGALPLDATLAAVPAVPVSVELRSAALMQAFPDPAARSRAVLAATRRVVET